jgi:DNA-binding NarL/FixJ family response regulator
MWASGTQSESGGLDVHAFHLPEQTTDMVAGWQQVNVEDTVAHACAHRPGWVMNAHMPTLFGSRDKRAMRDLTRRFGVGSALVTRYSTAQSSLVSWLSLYRVDASRHVLESDCADFEALVPHIVEASIINGHVHLDRLFAQEVRRDSALAIADRSGLLQLSDAAFASVLQCEWAGWDAEVLPDPLSTALAARPETTLRGHRIVVRSQRIGDLLFIHARPLTAVDRLSVRELEVARRFGAAQNHKEIARALDISPVTVRNHLQAIYRKLEVHDKAALAQLVATHF